MRNIALLIVLLVGVISPFLPGATARAEQEPVSRNGIVEHHIRAGDNLYLLAGYYYKDPRQWKRIYELNRDVLRDPSLVLPGQILKVRTDSARQWKTSYTDYLARVFR